MRVGNQWQDVAIRNVSSRGMMLSADEPPPTGSYIEIRKKMIVVVARAVWVRDDVFGIRTQDRVDLGELLDESGAPKTAWKPDASQDRRRSHRPDETAERSRVRSQRFQFVLALTTVVGVAGFLAFEVASLLDAPFSAVRHALGG